MQEAEVFRHLSPDKIHQACFKQWIINFKHACITMTQGLHGDETCFKIKDSGNSAIIELVLVISCSEEDIWRIPDGHKGRP